jgi:hypothetical protein
MASLDPIIVALDPAHRADLLALIREAVARPTLTDRILTTTEAIAYTKHESDSAFYRWAGRWRVTSAQNGRYARSQLDAALERETQKKRPAKPAPARPAPLSQKIAA